MKKAYKINGKFLMGEEWQHFKKEVIATNKTDAKETILSDIGSKHRVKRRSINIQEVVEIPLEKIENPVIKYLMEK